MKEYKTITIDGREVNAEFEIGPHGIYCNELGGKRWNFDAWGVNLPCKTRRAAALRLWRKIEK